MVSFSGTGSYFRHTTQQYLSPRLCSQMTSFLPGCHNTLYWQPLCLCELIMATSTSSPSWVLAQACPIAATLLLARLPPPQSNVPAGHALPTAKPSILWVTWPGVLSYHIILCPSPSLGFDATSTTKSQQNI